MTLATGELPEPFTPSDCDLRGLEYMPLLGHHLFGSEFNARATDADWRAALTLWWAAWMQVPAGSLPDDDVALCRLADLGRDVKLWRKLKSVALHKFVRCSDGRLYHPVLAKQALLAWDKRVKERDRKAQWRAKKEEKETGSGRDTTRPQAGTGPSQGRGRPGDKDGDATRTERGRDADVPADGTRRDGTIPPTPIRSVPCPPDLAAVIEAGGMSAPPSDHQLLREWLALPDMQLERDILPVVRRVAEGERGRTGRAPFKLKLFDAAVRQQHAEDEAEIRRLRQVRERIERQDREQDEQRRMAS